MAEKTIPIKGETYTFRLSLVDRASPMTFKDTPTLSAGDVKVSVDGGSFTNITTLPLASGKVVTVSLSASEMNGDSVAVLFSDAVGEEWCDYFVELRPAVANFSTIDGDLAVVDTIVDEILTDTGTDGVKIASGEILGLMVENGLTLQQFLQVFMAILAGEVLGGGTSTISFRDLADALNRVTASVDANGNRTSVTFNFSS